MWQKCPHTADIKHKYEGASPQFSHSRACDGVRADVYKKYNRKNVVNIPRIRYTAVIHSIRCDDCYYFSLDSSCGGGRKKGIKCVTKKETKSVSMGGRKVARCDGPGRVSTRSPAAAPAAFDTRTDKNNNISYYYYRVVSVYRVILHIYTYYYYFFYYYYCNTSSFAVPIVGRRRLLFAVRLVAVVCRPRCSNIIFHPRRAIAVDCSCSRRRRRRGFFFHSFFLPFFPTTGWIATTIYIYSYYIIDTTTIYTNAARTMTEKNSRAHTRTNADISLRARTSPIVLILTHVYTGWWFTKSV